MDKIILPAAQTIKVNGVPFQLNSDTLVTGNRENLKLLGEGYKSFGDPSVLCVSQDDTRDTTKPSSESINIKK